MELTLENWKTEFENWWNKEPRNISQVIRYIDALYALQRQATIAALWKIACSEDNPQNGAWALLLEVQKLQSEYSPSQESKEEV